MTANVFYFVPTMILNEKKYFLAAKSREFA